MNDKTTLKIPKYNLNLKINNNKNIVQAALEAGVKLSFSCRSGVCGTCKAKIINGKTDNSKGITHNLTNEEKSNNIIFTCQSLPLSKTLELEFLSPLSKSLLANDNKPKEYVVEILTINNLHESYIELITSFPKRIFTFLHDGMKIQLNIAGKLSENKYNIITPKLISDGSNNGLISIYIPINDKEIYQNLFPGETITIIGPHKSDIPINDKPYLFITNKENLISSLSKIKQILFINNDAKVMLISYYENKHKIQFMDEMHKLQNIYKGFNYKIIITKEKVASNTRFIFGKPEDVLNKIISNLNNHIIFTDKKNGKLIKKIIELEGLKENIY